MENCKCTSLGFSQRENAALPTVIKVGMRTQQGEDTPLPVMSKQEHDGEQACPLSHPNWNGNMMRRVYPLLAMSKWDNATRRGKPPPHCV